MATKQSNYFKGNARTPQPVSHKAGDSVVVLATHIFTEDVATTDVLELIQYPAGMKLVDFVWNTENISTTTLNFGIMSGTPGDTATRTCGTEFGATATAGTQAATTLVNLQAAANAVSAENRSIGFVPTVASITAGATKKLHIRATFAG